MQRTLKVGIVGLGRLGQRHAENLAHHVPHAELVAACSPLEQEREWAGTTLGVAHCYAGYAELLAHPGLDAVFLVTPTALHAEQIISALQAGKHVFCEKPLSLDLDDCLRVEAEAARHPELKVMIGFVRRFDASYRDAARKIGEGLIGKPYLIRSQTMDQNDPGGFFVRFAATSGGIFLDCSVHDIDLVRWLLDYPVPQRVYAIGTNVIHQGLREFDDVDNGMATLEFRDGSMASFMASRTSARSTSRCWAKGESAGVARKISSENSGNCSQSGSLTLSSREIRMASTSMFLSLYSRSILEPRIRSMFSSLRRSFRPMISCGTVFTVSE